MLLNKLSKTRFFVCLSILIVWGCGQKSASKTAAATTSSASTPGVTAASGSSLNLTGTLALSSGLNLASTQPNGILVYNMASGQPMGLPTKIEVKADGSFTAPVNKSNAAVVDLVAQVKLPRSGRNWTKMLADIQVVFGTGGQGPQSVAQLEGMAESDLQQGIGQVASAFQSAGAMTMLVAYTKSATGDTKAEAESFHFIGMPTSEGNVLSGLPNGGLKGNLDFGKITGSGTDITSALGASKATSLSASAIEQFAQNGQALKMVKNAYMNKLWNIQPFYFWEGKISAVTDFIGAYSDATKNKYQGYGFYSQSQGTPQWTMAQICGGLPLVFTPPQPLTVIGNQDSNGNITNATVTSYTNQNTQMSTQNGKQVCFGNGFYARADLADDGVTIQDFELNFGAGGSILSTPIGLWTMSIGGTNVANFDVALGSPVDSSGNPLVLVPEVQFTETSGSITSASIKLFRYHASAYEQVTDMAAVKALFSEIVSSVSDSSGNEWRSTATINADGSITAAFDSSQTEQGQAINAPVLVNKVSSYSVSYQIGNAQYRTEWRPAGDFGK